MSEKLVRRREGFSGQHLVVLPESVARQVRSRPLLRSLLPTDAGLFPRAAGHLVERPHGTPATVLIVCLAGRGWYRLGPGDESRVQAVPAGTALFLPAGVAHAYGADERDPWSVEWAHFTGGEAPGWLQLLGVSAERPALLQSPEAAADFGLGRVYEWLERGYTEANLVSAAAALRVALAAILRGRRATAEASGDMIDASLEWMRVHCGEPVTLAALARRAAYSVPRYSELFRSRTGFSPIDFLIRLRIQRACQLLDTTQLKVAAVGQAVGYDDPYYFSRQFRKIVGRSPRDYREVPKG